ncbi:hypothetical protein ACF0H5_009717 [Mactra antiquata]
MFVSSIGMNIFWLTFLCLFVFTDGVDQRRLEKIPPVMKGFNVQGIYGTWYAAFRVAPCGWSKSGDFEDYQLEFLDGGAKRMLVNLWARNTICSAFSGIAFATSVPGIYKIEDPIGDKFSGTFINVATDYKTFLIDYICTKMSLMGDKCDDALLNVMTRVPNYMSKDAVYHVNNILMSTWGLTLDQMPRMKQQQSCRVSKQHFF